MSAAVMVAGLRKSYGEVAAVRDISFEIAEGEVVAVLGPNGAGKTTTVEILEGYRTRDSGTVSVLGSDPEHGGSALRERVGIVLQEAGVDHYLTVSEAVRMHSELYRQPLGVDEVVDLVGLEEKRNARIKTLSGGQKRRLDVALALIGDPELLFLDEPTTGFDPTARRQAWEVIKSLCNLGKTVLLTTHYMDEAQYLADRVIVIAAGRVVAEGPPSSIGGRASARARIRFELPHGVEVADLPVGTVAIDRRSVLIETAEPTGVLHRLTGWAVERGVELDGLAVDRPSLEDVYLELTAEQAES
ncbi:MAG TPA: ABC transporter ATP-binding protein [Acidimicrobiales bacterium]|nr:ABC transporter ATP-binding protein [Acidimicrobiales bacterium]